MEIEFDTILSSLETESSCSVELRLRGCDSWITITTSNRGQCKAIQKEIYNQSKKGPLKFRVTVSLGEPDMEEFITENLKRNKDG